MAVIDLPLCLTAPVAARPQEVGRAAAVRPLRIYYAVLAALGLAAFVLDVENRFTSVGLFFFAPPLDLVPPLSAARWSEAYTLHQQDPIFAACGGSESLDEFKLLYMWNWGARAAALLFGAATASGVVGAIAMPRFRAALPRLAALASLAAAYLIVSLATGLAVTHFADLSRYNAGQYRHAVDVVFASAALAMVLYAVARPLPSATRSDRGRTRWYAWLVVGLILLEIAFGAMFATRNAAAVWTTWPGYEGAPLPPLERLISFSPLWLNLTVNQYTIQFAHRAVSIALWVGALFWLFAAVRGDRPRVTNALALLALLSAQMAAGIVALIFGTPPLLSIAHQLGAGFLLAGAFAVLRDPSPPQAGFGALGAVRGET